MTTDVNTPLSFAYRALTRDGQSIAGTIDAINLIEATRRLQALQLAQVQVESAPRPPRARALRGDDFLAFNQQLAQLTHAGLPVEQGLRLVAADMRRGSMKRTLDLVAADLESGKTLPQAIDAHRAQFPPLYARLVEAGIKAGNLPRILLNLGRHLALVRRLQAMIWRTFSYPVLVMATFTAIICFVLVRVLPEFAGTFKEFGASIPLLTRIMMDISAFLAGGAIWYAVGGLALLVGLCFAGLWMIGRDRAVAESLLLPMPLIGPILSRNLVSRWCDAVGLGVESGMDLPAAIGMADDAIGSPALAADGQGIIDAVSSGKTIAQAPAGRVIPPMVIVGIHLASTRNDLPEGLRTYSQLYEQQAEQRLATIEAMLTPLVVIVMGCVVALLMMSLFAPFITLIQTISSPVHH